MQHENAVAEATGERLTSEMATGGNLDQALARAVRRLIAEAVEAEATAIPEATPSAA